MAKRTFRAVAQDIRQNWKNIYFGAKPYVEAMETLDTSDPNARYLYEDAKSIVLYFLANAATFRGPEARRIKAELKEMVK